MVVRGYGNKRQQCAVVRHGVTGSGWRQASDIGVTNSAAAKSASAGAVTKGIRENRVDMDHGFGILRQSMHPRHIYSWTRAKANGTIPGGKLPITIVKKAMNAWLYAV